MENINPKTINVVRVEADLKTFDSPKDSITNLPVKFRQFDSFRMDVVFLQSKMPADLSNVVSACVEIFDIGEINSPLPRTSKLIMQKTVEAASINLSLDEASVSAGGAHASFYFDADDTAVAEGNKWMRICVYAGDFSRTTFCEGWIDVVPSPRDSSADGEISESIPCYLTKTEGEVLFLKRGNNLSDLAEPAAARNSLGVYAKSDIDAKDLCNMKKSANLSDVSSAAQARSNIGAVSAEDAQKLMRRKIERPSFCMRGGYATNTAMTAVPEVFSMCISFRITVAEWASVTNYALVYGYYNGGARGGAGFYKTSNGLSLFYSTANYDISNTVFNPDAVAANGEWHTLALTVSNAAVSVYLDGTLYGSKARHIVETATCLYSRMGWVTFKGRLSRILLVNFDMSAASSPYTISDYDNFVPINPALKLETSAQRVIAEYEDYVFNGMIPDVSGNGYDLTVSGSMEGDNDKSIARQYQLFAAAITNNQ